MLRVAICDDMPAMTSDLERLIQAYPNARCEVTVFFTAANLVAALADHHYDLFILDIELPTSSGIEIAKAIRERDLNVPVVFLTNYSEYMEEVFQVQTFDYILKPITAEKLFPVLAKVIRYLDLEDDYFSFTFRQTVYNLRLADVLYFEKQRRTVIIHTRQGTYQALLSTAELLAKLNDGFVQVHQSFVVNIDFIKEVGAAYVIVASADQAFEVPIGRKFRVQAKDAMIMKMRRKL